MSSESEAEATTKAARAEEAEADKLPSAAASGNGEDPSNQTRSSSPPTSSDGGSPSSDSHSPSRSEREHSRNDSEPRDEQKQNQGQETEAETVAEGAAKQNTEEASQDGAQPPLPAEPAPPQEDDGWDAVWSAEHGAWYFFNRFTQQSQWDNPRIPEATSTTTATATTAAASTAAGGGSSAAAPGLVGGYNPAIHGDYDPTAWYAQKYETREDEQAAEALYNATAAAALLARDAATRLQHQQADSSDEARARRQLNAFFDVDAAANLHDGRSLKAERSGKKPSKAELKAFKEKRRAKKEEKRRAWLRD